MNGAALSLTVKSPGAHFGCAGVVKASGSPGLLDAAFDALDARPRFARVNCGMNSRRAHVQPHPFCHLGQMERVGRGANQHRAITLNNHAQPLLGAQAATGYAQRADMTRAIYRGPVAQVRTEGESTKDQVLLAHACAPIDITPAT